MITWNVSYPPGHVDADDEAVSAMGATCSRIESHASTRLTGGAGDPSRLDLADPTKLHFRNSNHTDYRVLVIIDRSPALPDPEDLRQPHTVLVQRASRSWVARGVGAGAQPPRATKRSCVPCSPTSGTAHCSPSQWNHSTNGSRPICGGGGQVCLATRLGAWGEPIVKSQRIPGGGCVEKEPKHCGQTAVHLRFH